MIVEENPLAEIDEIVKEEVITPEPNNHIEIDEEAAIKVRWGLLRFWSVLT
jgi:hypothetical protein